MHEKTVPLSNEKGLLAVLYMVGLEKNNPKTNCEVTKCPMNPVLLKIILCMTAALRFFLQNWLRTAREDII